MFDTGRRTIAQVLSEHVGHSVEIRDVVVGEFVTGVRLICRTCGYQLLSQDHAEQYPVESETSAWVESQQVTPASTGGSWDTGWSTE